MFVMPIEAFDERFDLLGTVATCWWDSPREVGELQDSRGRPRKAIVRAILFDAYVFGAQTLPVEALVESISTDPHAAELESRVRQEYRDVCQEAFSAANIQPEVRGPFGEARFQLREGATAVRRKFF